MDRDSSIVVTGAAGLLGHHLMSLLRREGFRNIHPLTRADCDLTDRAATRSCFARLAPAYVFHTAGYVAGIMGNMRNQGLAFLNNTLINTHVVDACHHARVSKIVAMGTVAMYPDALADEAMQEADVWRDVPHGSERGYAHAKRGMLAQLDVYRESYGLNYACALSTNLYGPHDRFDPEQGHVIPSLVRKFHEARETGGTVTVWGNGTARRDFLHAADAARGLVLMMDRLDGAVNLASGHTHAIREAVEILTALTNMHGRVTWDTAKPNGQLRRAYDVSRMGSVGFRPQISLEAGLRDTSLWFAEHALTARRHAS